LGSRAASSNSATQAKNYVQEEICHKLSDCFRSRRNPRRTTKKDPCCRQRAPIHDRIGKRQGDQEQKPYTGNGNGTGNDTDTGKGTGKGTGTGNGNANGNGTGNGTGNGNDNDKDNSVDYHTSPLRQGLCHRFS
jgi:hypothetical protein